MNGIKGIIMNKCPLCEGKDLKQLFKADNTFVSVAEIQKAPYKKIIIIAKEIQKYRLFNAINADIFIM